MAMTQDEFSQALKDYAHAAGLDNVLGEVLEHVRGELSYAQRAMNFQRIEVLKRVEAHTAQAEIEAAQLRAREEVESAFSDLWKDEYGVRPALSAVTMDEMLRYIEGRRA